jgi:D-threo-aldose 1-dehydrogenase
VLSRRNPPQRQRNSVDETLLHFMTSSNDLHRPFGKTEIVVPPIAFRTDVLENSSRVLPEKTKRLICSEWLGCVKPPLFIDVVFNEGHKIQVATIGHLLAHFDVAPDEVVINLELAAADDPRNLAEPQRIRTQFGKACDLLGKSHMPRLVTLRVARNGSDLDAQSPNTVAQVVDAVHELHLLKDRYDLAAIGIAVCDWRLGRLLHESADVGFIKLVNGPTILRHPPEMKTWLADLAADAIPVITAGVFHGGFLVGGPTLDGRIVSSNAPVDRSLFTWRKSFSAICHGHGVRPAHACVQFALSMPGVIAASLSTSHPDRVVDTTYAATTPVPIGLWESMKEEGLMSQDYEVAPA